ncbi:hypothetical protein EUGRSUZ_F03804 [Eucalyptus grandis]|uniref:Uncharacterized protein n=2 Tax=Eucalyptus grandis TaxID=71139 RepID=A0ACC3KNA3_EUCGR|nr:hypothetical protein EUGRSUZ_F03804 [Eucalyptus grandis]
MRYCPCPLPLPSQGPMLVEDYIVEVKAFASFQITEKMTNFFYSLSIHHFYKCLVQFTGRILIPNHQPY